MPFGLDERHIRQHADDPAAICQNCVGNGSHETAVGTAINQRVPLLSNPHAKSHGTDGVAFLLSGRGSTIYCYIHLC